MTAWSKNEKAGINTPWLRIFAGSYTKLAGLLMYATASVIDRWRTEHEPTTVTTVPLYRALTFCFDLQTGGLEIESLVIYKH